MGKITLIQDLGKTYQGSFDLQISKIDDYVEGYNSILQAIYKKIDFVVIVRNKHCMSWLKKMQQQYLENRICLTIYSAKVNLKELVGISVPDYISDDDIVKDEFIIKSDKFIFSKNSSFEDNILNNYLGIYFTQEQFPFSKLYELLLSLDFDLISNIKKYNILSKVYKRKLEQWNANCINEAQKIIFSEFINNAKELLKILSKFSILKGYPINIQSELVGDLAKAFNKLNLKINAFIPDSLDTMEIRNNIRLFLNNLDVANLQEMEFEENIKMLSGQLSEEIQFIYRLVEENKSIVSKNIIHQISFKFEGSNLIDSNFEQYISNLVPPNYVLNPDSNNSMNDWINWAISSYLPYKFWMEDTNTSDSVIDSFSKKYGDWVFNNYDSLISSEPRLIYNTIKKISDYLKNDSISIIIMIDNFNYKYVDYCKEYFQNNGYSLTKNEPMLSMIPTSTEVSKYAFFSGEPFNSSDMQYSAMCQKWENILQKSVKYLPNVLSLDSILEKDGDIYILNYLSLDKVLHDNAKDSAIPLKQRMRDELNAMINKVMSFIHRLGVENSIKIYIISDHGSTKIVEGQDNLILPKFHKDKSEEAGFRYIKLDDNKFNTYKDSLGNLCYPMNKSEYGVKYNYMIAKEYNRFLKTDEHTYVHGGISPEEHIIPLLKFEKINITINKPSIVLKNKIFRFNTLANFVLEIKNFNEYEINNLNIIILNNNIKVKCDEFNLGDIESYKLKEYIISNARITNNKEVNQYLKLQLNYEFVGKKYSDTIELELNIKSTQENKTNLDDLF